MDFFIFSRFVAAFVASICEMVAMTNFGITNAYPFMSLAPALVFIIGILFLIEMLTMARVNGLLLILLVLLVTVK